MRSIERNDFRKTRLNCVSSESVTTELLEGDCISHLENLPPDSIDLALTDPPYNLGLFMQKRATNLSRMRSNYFGSAGWDVASSEEWHELMDKFFAKLVKTLRPGANVIVFMAVLRVETIVNIAERYGLYYKTTGIWHKLNPMPRNMNLHFVNSTESWIYFTYKAKKGTFNNGGSIRHDFIESSITPHSEKAHGKHPTQKPIVLMRHFVELLSNPGDRVLDPFMGSGSAGVAAVLSGRSFVGIELEQQYFAIAENRIREALLAGVK